MFSRVLVAFSMDGQAYNHSIEVFTGRAQLYDPRTAPFARARRAGEVVDGLGKQKRATISSVHSSKDHLLYVDQDWDGALVLEADLGEHVGRFVRLSLTATDGWILLSEVQFNSCEFVISQVGSSLCNIYLPLEFIESASCLLRLICYAYPSRAKRDENP